MTHSRKKFVAGNWKMNGTRESLQEIRSLKKSMGEVNCDILICPPTSLLYESVKIVMGSRISIGAQNCHHKISGAHTGEVSAAMLKDLDVEMVILGHSERRTENDESSNLVNQKAEASHNSGLKTIICVGETEKERLGNETEKVISEQISESFPSSATENNTIIAYEPIWAIGTGRTPTFDEISEVHTMLRSLLEKLTKKSLASKIRIIYGGSVNPENCSKILQIDGVDGALVGGASLEAKDFLKIIRSA